MPEALFSRFQPLNPGNGRLGTGCMHSKKISDRVDEWRSQILPYISKRRMTSCRFIPDDSALLVVDMQRFFLDEESHAFIPGSKDIIENINTLIDVYRQRGRPVLFTKHALMKDEDPGAMGKWWADVIREESPSSQISECMHILPTERVIRKTKYSAFVGTDLEETLSSLGVSQIMLTGVQTHLCCESTARDAFMKGFDVFAVIDGMASMTEELHVSSLRTLTHGFAMPVTTAEVMRWLR